MASINLFVQNDETLGDLKISLDDVWIESDVTDEESLHAALVTRIAVWAIAEGAKFTQVSGFAVEDDAGQELAIGHDSGDPAWIREVAQLYMWLICDKHYCDDEAILAYIDNVGWQWFDFDSGLRTAEGEYRQEFPGDYEDFAREQMEELGEYLDDHLERHFDYYSYGEELIEKYSKVSWGYREFLFSE